MPKPPQRPTGSDVPDLGTSPTRRVPDPRRLRYPIAMENTSAVLALVRHALGPAAQSPEAKIALSWDRLVGSVAEGAVPAGLQGRTLLVTVDHPARLARVQFASGAILSAVRQAYPDIAIERIRAVVSTDRPNPTPTAPADPPPPIEVDAATELSADARGLPPEGEPAAPDRDPPVGKAALLEHIRRIAATAPSESARPQV